MKREIPKLKDYCIKISSGGTPSRDTNEYFENGTIPWVKSKELKSNIILKTEEKITLQGLKNSSTKLYPIDTVLLAMYGVNIGQVGYLGIEATINQAICGIITNKKILDPKFLYYYLTSIPSYFDSVSFGAAQQNINQDLIKNLKIEIPELITQQLIASILSAYDDLIEVNNQRIKLLKETARELYKEWFVRMRFPGYKKAKFVKGVPEGIGEVKYFKDFIKLNRGFDLPEEKIKEGSYPVIASTSIKGYHNQYKVKGPIITTGRSGSLGTVLFVNQDGWPLNTSLYVKDFKSNEPLYLYYTLKLIDFESFNTGAGVPTLNQNHLHKLKMWVADEVLQKKFKKWLSQCSNKLRF
ncbi:MAG: restriction endonuclease subunit S [Bacteroidetes bacterium]|nr:restriction endonuclease subunit S [Bacteroidota bacterium]